MRPRFLLLMLCLAAFSPPSAVGFSSDGSAVERVFTPAISLTNCPIRVTVTFTNGGANSLRGFFYSEQLPAELDVRTVGISLNGQVITNFAYDTDYVGDVYSGCIPRRWRLETPTDFVESNPLVELATCEIVYTINSPTQGSYNCQHFSWAGYSPGSTNSSFGCSEPTQQQVVYFLTTTNRPMVSAEHTASGTLVSLSGDPGGCYVLEASPNLKAWVPVATNFGSFSYTDVQEPIFSSRWYRGRLQIGER